MGKQLKSVFVNFEKLIGQMLVVKVWERKFTTSFFHYLHTGRISSLCLWIRRTLSLIRRTASAVLFWRSLIFYGCKQKPTETEFWHECYQFSNHLALAAEGLRASWQEVGHRRQVALPEQLKKSSIHSRFQYPQRAVTALHTCQPQRLIWVI